MLSKIKVELLEDEEHEEVNLKAQTAQILEIKKKELSEFLDSIIKSVQVDFAATL